MHSIPIPMHAAAFSAKLSTEELYSPLRETFDALETAAIHNSFLDWRSRRRSRVGPLSKTPCGISPRNNFPFGGVGASGRDHCHGREGFHTFSKRRPLFFLSRLTTIGLFKPPYGRLFDTFVSFLIG